MRRSFLLISFLAACTPEVPPEVSQGELVLAGQTYPITARGDKWFVRTEVGRVQCLHATQEDCYWSLRAHLQVQAALDDAG